MAYYYRLGLVPRKRHIQFRASDGGLYCEELFGTESFDGIYSLLYHRFPPTSVTSFSKLESRAQLVWEINEHRHHHLKTSGIRADGDILGGRVPLLFNEDVSISILGHVPPTDAFFRNGTADELFFVHRGEGTLTSVFGIQSFGIGDYLYIPRGTTYQLQSSEDSRFLLVESPSAIKIPRRYRNEFGQLVESAPYYTRSIRPPESLVTKEERGEFRIVVKLGESQAVFMTDHHPFDVVGWDGYLYPFGLNVSDLSPIVGKLHQPPTVHETFSGERFMVGTFAPRLFDFDPEAVPVPYYHNNIDSDEILFYSAGSFMSRRGIEEGSITLHRRGIHHGPQPGVVEASLGKKSTDELAVMVEAYKPFKLTSFAKAIDDPSYQLSWTKK
jgi:homogentisate 1,2-dioxygenase